jgi:hypothetical protein
MYIKNYSLSISTKPNITRTNSRGSGVVEIMTGKFVVAVELGNVTFLINYSLDIICGMS